MVIQLEFVDQKKKHSIDKLIFIFVAIGLPIHGNLSFSWFVLIIGVYLFVY